MVVLDVKAAVAASERAKVGPVTPDLDGRDQGDDDLRAVVFHLGRYDPRSAGVQITEDIAEEPRRNGHREPAHRFEGEWSCCVEGVVERASAPLVRSSPRRSRRMKLPVVEDHSDVNDGEPVFAADVPSRGGSPFRRRG